MPTIEAYKVKSGTSPAIKNHVFRLRKNNHYNLCQVSKFTVSNVNSVFNRRESASHLKPVIWEFILTDKKQKLSQSVFKKKQQKIET